MAEGGAKRLRCVPNGGAKRRVNSVIDCCAGWKGRYGETFKGVDGGVFEIVLRHRGDAFRVIYAVQIGAALWVIHAFQKKSKTGIKTPKAEVDLIRERLKRLKEALK